MSFIRLLTLCFVLFITLTRTSYAGILPEERVDFLYHSYEGGNVTVNGPSVLVRKNVSNNTSVYLNSYIDYVTSASLDVMIGGSEYEEERSENSFGVDYLNGKSTLTFSYTSSTENDYDAESFHFGVSQDFFGDLTTLSMGYSMGNDTVRQNGNAAFSEPVERQNYRIGLSQIFTKNFVGGFGFETITDEGFLRNPYRSYSYLDAGNRAFAAEIYPGTRTSNALAFRGSYYLPYRAALHGEYKIFQDSWGIDGTTIEVSYTQPYSDWIFDVHGRLYSQTQADFYNDNFDFANQFTFMARDKELSTFQSFAVGFNASYEFSKNGWGWIDKGSLNVSVDRITFDYDNFRDATESVLFATAVAGQESLYSFTATVIQLYISLWF